MIIQIKEDNKTLMLEYLYKDEAYNIMPIGYLLHYPLEKNHEAFIQMEDDKIVSCFLRFYTRGFFYSDTNLYNQEEIGEFINTFTLDRISAPKESIHILKDHLQNVIHVVDFIYSKCDKLNQLSDHIFAEEAKKEDLEDILTLMKQTKFLTRDYVEINTQKIENKAGRLYFVKRDGIVIASCETSNETPTTALVGEVMTHPSYRRQHIATNLVYKLCEDLILEGKMPYLFYNDPNAGKIYHHIGFQDIGYFSILVFKQNV